MPLKLRPPRPGRTPYWSVRGTHLGQYVDRSTGIGDRRKAQRVLEQIRDDIERGAFQQQARGDTFSAAALSYMRAGGERRYLEPILKHFGSRPLQEIDQSAIDRAAVELYPEGSAATRNRQVYTPVSAVLKHAGVSIDLRRPKGAAGTARTLWMTPKQAEAIAQVADDRIRPVFVFCLYTGCRIGEALALSWADVDLDGGTAWVAETKNDDPRLVHLPPSVVAELANLPLRKGQIERAGSVFRWTRGGAFYAAWRAMAKAAGLEWVTPHVCRHTYATWLRRFGKLDIKGVAAAGGWRDLKSVARYSHVVVQEEARASDLFPVLKKNGSGT